MQGTAVTYRYFHAPELTAHLAAHLHGDLCGHAHQHVRSAQCASHYALTGHGELQTQVLFHLVILVLPVAREDNHHLTNEKICCSAHKGVGRSKKQNEIELKAFTSVIHILITSTTRLQLSSLYNVAVQVQVCSLHAEYIIVDRDK